MIEVWQDAEVPVEYQAPELHFQNWGKVGFFANLIQTLSPLIIIIISFLFVVMSYYVAPSSLLIKETPSVYPPYYYLAVGNLMNKTEGANYYTNIVSFLYSNFPQFTENLISSYTVGGRCMSAVTDSGYLDVQIELPYQKVGDVKLIQLTILLPLTINFPKMEHKNVHTMIHYQVSQDDIHKVHTVGRFLFTQQRTLNNDEKYAESSMKEVLSKELHVNDTSPFDIDYILQQFSTSAFTSKIVKISETIEPESSSPNDSVIRVHLEIRIPEIFAEIRAPFWNMFKVTYVQLFYWFWLVYFVWSRFIRTGFVYGIIPATVHHVLKPAKKKMD